MNLTLLLYYRLHLVYMYLETGRGKEARDAARASLGQPAWTVGKDQSVSIWGQEMSSLFLTFSTHRLSPVAVLLDRRSFSVLNCVALSPSRCLQYCRT
jgi:hypothetical protein